jgi:hypothetical protein
MSNSTQTLPHNALIGKWDLYYHLPSDSNWDLSSFKVIMTDIDSAEKIISLNENIPESLVKYCMLFVMRKGITPLWEDPKNRQGGCFSFKVINNTVHSVWKSLLYALCGETLCVNKKHMKIINGITISPKKKFCIIRIWLLDCSIQDPSMFANIPGLEKKSCLFKQHEPEF